MNLCFIGRHWWKEVELEDGGKRGRGRICNHCSRKEIHWQGYRAWEYAWMTESQVEEDLTKRKRSSDIW